MPGVHDPIYCRIQVQENIGVNIRFLSYCPAHTIRLLYRRQKSEYLVIFIGVLHGPRSHCWITSLRLFMKMELAHTIRFIFIADK